MSPSSLPSSRRPDIDWLRVLATYLLFAFHAGKVFDVPPFYHIKNAELSPHLNLFTGFVHYWHMPLFFLLAGWSAAGSIRLRGPAGFMRERVSRLFVPLAFGIVAFGPFLRWVELRGGLFMTITGRRLPAEPNVSFLDFLPRYFAFENLTWAHLWFVAYLFTFSLLYLPLLARLVRRAPSSWAPSAALVYLPILPLAIIQMTLRGRWPGYQNLIDDWANFSYYSLFFLLGAALAHLPTVERAAQREWKRAGLIAIATAVAMLGIDAWRATGSPYAPFAGRFLSAIVGWCAVISFLGIAARFLAFSNGALRYLAESAFPVYVLHQVAVVGVALWVCGLSLGIGAKFWLVTVLATVATVGVYHVAVRPVRSLRVLLGMKPAAAATPVRAARAEAMAS